MIALSKAPAIPGFSALELDRLGQMLGILARKRAINETRRNYDEAKQDLKNLGIAIPAHLTATSVALEWPRAAWKHLANRVNFETFTLPDGGTDRWGIDRIVRENHWDLEATMTEAEAYKYGPAFIMVLAGLPGEPGVVMRGLSARATTVLWDPNRRRVTAALSVTKTKGAQAVELIYADDESVKTASLDDHGWTVASTPVHIGRCPVAVLPHAPDLENPLGRSRISQGVMATTDRAMRTLLRMELTSEFFSAPQRYLLGADPDAFVNEDGTAASGWTSLIGRWNAISRDETDQLPSIWQAPQVSMQPHIDMLRSDASVFSGLTNIPMGALGVIHDNPSSSEAMETAYMALDKDAEDAIRSFSSGHVDAMRMGVMIRDGLTEVPDELWGLEAKYRPVSTPTRSAAADAMQKELAALPWLADTEVALEGFGHDAATIARLMSHRRRLEGRDSLEAILGGVKSSDEPSVIDDAAAIKAKADALGILIRAGVEPAVAAERVGLAGVKFTGAVPVSLRLPETDASRLEE